VPDRRSGADVERVPPAKASTAHAATGVIHLAARKNAVDKTKSGYRHKLGKTLELTMMAHSSHK
jgi:hypothetical protein